MNTEHVDGYNARPAGAQLYNFATWRMSLQSDLARVGRFVRFGVGIVVWIVFCGRSEDGFGFCDEIEIFEK